MEFKVALTKQIRPQRKQKPPLRCRKEIMVGPSSRTIEIIRRHHSNKQLSLKVLPLLQTQAMPQHLTSQQKIPHKSVKAMPHHRISSHSNNLLIITAAKVPPQPLAQVANHRINRMLQRQRKEVTMRQCLEMKTPKRVILSVISSSTCRKRVVWKIDKDRSKMQEFLKMVVRRLKMMAVAAQVLTLAPTAALPPRSGEEGSEDGAMLRSEIRCCVRRTYWRSCQTHPGRSSYNRCQARCSNREPSARAFSSPLKDTLPPQMLTRPDTPHPRRVNRTRSKMIKLWVRKQMMRSKIPQSNKALRRKTPSLVELLMDSRVNRKHKNCNEEDYKLEWCK